MKKFSGILAAVLSAVLLAAAGAPAQAVQAAGTDSTYESELTGLPTDISLKDQRPIAVMVDNEKVALPHYGTAQADVVYETLLSTANNRITRLMCIYKDWKNVARIGNIRSTRPTNILLAAEWNAVLFHDGGPFYNKPYFREYPVHCSGDFRRFKNGKAIEFTDYIVKGIPEQRMKRAGISESYDVTPDAPHFTFAEEGTTVDLSGYGTPASAVSLPFYHNSSKLVYNKKTGLYDYQEYGKIHKDADTSALMSFDNVILQDVSIHVYDRNGYLIYNCIGERQPALYITKGYAVPVYWSKKGTEQPTTFFYENGEPVEMNRGKTYIALVPSDSWNKVSCR